MDFNRYVNTLPWGKRGTPEHAAYGAEEQRIMALFRTEAIEEVGLTGHPRAGKAFDYAWQQGHAYGYSEVFSHLSDIADVLRD